VIEQLRDVIRAYPQKCEWLDPLKHYYLDLAEFLSADEQDQRLVFRSLEYARVYRVETERSEAAAGQVLLTADSRAGMWSGSGR
jgi:hypothetical protein